eukprot:scaffold308_cov327-Pavlova_lutheri.AAC.24
MCVTPLRISAPVTQWTRVSASYGRIPATDGSTRWNQLKVAGSIPAWSVIRYIAILNFCRSGCDRRGSNARHRRAPMNPRSSAASHSVPRSDHAWRCMRSSDSSRSTSDGRGNECCVPPARGQDRRALCFFFAHVFGARIFHSTFALLSFSSSIGSVDPSWKFRSSRGVGFVVVSFGSLPSPASSFPCSWVCTVVCFRVPFIDLRSLWFRVGLVLVPRFRHRSDLAAPPGSFKPGWNGREHPSQRGCMGGSVCEGGGGETQGGERRGKACASTDPTRPGQAGGCPGTTNTRRVRCRSARIVLETHKTKTKETVALPYPVQNGEGKSARET